ncbi:MAG: DNRLRE domain-containing protein [Gaiellaceae bacterium]
MVALMVLAVSASFDLDQSARAVDPIWTEIATKRTATSRTFVNAEGIFKTEAFEGAVNYKDIDNRWQPIDSELISSTEPGFAFENKANAFKVRFRQELSEDFLSFDVRGSRFGLTLEGAARKSGNKGLRQIGYENALAGVDVRYDIVADGVKETLHLADRSAPTSYRFSLSLPEKPAIRIEKLQQGSWALFTEQEEAPLFVFEAPYASDATGARAPDGAAKLNIERTGQRLTLELSLDAKWLQAAERRFPVSLDPTILIQPPSQAVDFYAPCPSYDPDCLVYVRDRLWVGTNDTSASRSALRFDLSAMPANADVNSAKLDAYFIGECVYTNAAGGACPATSHQIDVHRMTVPWSEGNATTLTTLARNMSYDTDPTKKVSTTLPSGAAPQWLNWDVTNIVDGWFGSGGANNGFLLKRATEPLGASGPVIAGRTYVGTNLDESQRPKLEVTYTGAPAVELETPLVVNATGAVLKWSPFGGAGAFAKYEVHRSFTAGFTPSSSTLLATITNQATTTYTDTTGEPETTQSYRVVTNSIASNEQIVSLPLEGQVTKIVQPTAADGKATSISSDSSDAMRACKNAGADSDLRVGTAASLRERGLMQFDLSFVPSGAEVLDAEMSLWDAAAAPGDEMIDVRPLNAAWDEGASSRSDAGCAGAGATWNQATGTAAWSGAGGDFDADQWGSLSRTDGAPGRWDSFDVTGLVASWRNGTRANYGLILVADDAGGSSTHITSYASDNNTQPVLRPRLAVTYALAAAEDGAGYEAGTDGASPSGYVTPIDDSSAVHHPDGVIGLQSLQAAGAPYTEPVDFWTNQDGITFLNDDGAWTILWKCIGPTAGDPGAARTVGPGYISTFDDRHFKPVVTGQPVTRYNTRLIDGYQPSRYTVGTNVERHIADAGGLGIFGVHHMRGSGGPTFNLRADQNDWSGVKRGQAIEGQKCGSTPHPTAKEGGVYDVKIENCTQTNFANCPTSTWVSGTKGTLGAVGRMDIDVWFREGRGVESTGYGKDGRGLFLVKYRWRFSREIVKLWTSVTTYAKPDANGTPFVAEPKFVTSITGKDGPERSGPPYLAGEFPRVALFNRQGGSFVRGFQGAVVRNAVVVQTEHTRETGRTRVRWDYQHQRPSPNGRCALDSTENACLSVVSRAYRSSDIIAGNIGGNSKLSPPWQSGNMASGLTDGGGLDAWAVRSKGRAAARASDSLGGGRAWSCNGASPKATGVRRWEIAGRKNRVTVRDANNFKVNPDSYKPSSATMFHGWEAGSGAYDCETLYRAYGSQGESFGWFATFDLNDGYPADLTFK